MKTLQKLIEELPPDLQREAEDFIAFIIKKHKKTQKGKPKFQWANTLSDLSDQYTSVELQHKISEWRIGG